MRRLIDLLYAALVLLTVLPVADGAVFFLHSGGKIEGELVNADENPRANYIISLANGGQVTLAAGVVDKVEADRPELVQYQKVRRQTPDTVDGNWKMSDWCRDHNLLEQRKIHLERITKLDPNNDKAWKLLGYHKYKDRWMTLEDEMDEKGYVKYDGRWLTSKEVEVRQGHEKQHAAEIEWIRKISMWHSWLRGNQAEQGKKNLLAITDPMAVAGLADKLVKKIDPSSDARLIYVAALANIARANIDNRHDGALAPLAMCAMDDPVEEVRLSSLDELVQQKDQAVVDYFVRRMRNKHASNTDINRGGLALGKLKDPSTVDTLIESLVTIHDRIVQGGGQPGQMSTTFNKKGGGGGMSMNQQPQTIRETLENPDVLDALVAITGQSFGYDQRAWSTWYSNQKSKGLPVAAAKN